ncbi:two-component regulator propeller domain-containing protein [Calditrichota bacterium GD2]
MTRPLLILLFVFKALTAQGVGDWQTLTYMDNINSLIADGNLLWAVSDGGLFNYDVHSTESKKFTNTDGLRSIKLNRIVQDQYGQIIVGGQEGLIQYYDPSKNTWQYQYALEGNNINHIFAKQDTLWVCAEKGIGVFVYDGAEYVFKDFFRNFPLTVENIFASAVFAGQIWLGTDKGLLSAPSDFGRFPINDPQRWQTFGTTQGLPSNGIRALLPTEDKLWVGTSAGLAYVDKQKNIVTVNNWWKNDQNEYQPVEYLVADAASGVIYPAFSVFITRYTLSAGYQVLKTYKFKIQGLAIDGTGQLWAALNNNGIKNLDDLHIKLDGPPSNLIRTVFKDHRKNIWASSSRPKIILQDGIYVHNGELWQKWTFRGPYWQTVNNVDVIYEDRYNNLWFGTWGGGVMVITSSNDTIFFHSHDLPGSLEISDIQKTRIIDPAKYAIYRDFFKGVVIDENYEVITAIKEGPRGRLWFANYWAANGNLLAVAPYEENGFVSLDKNKWVYFGASDGIVAKEGGVLCIEFDNFANRVYIGTLSNGVFILDYGNSLENKADDRLYQLTIQDNLFSNTVFSLAMDQDGVLWIGTAAGLNSFDGLRVYKHVGDDLGLSGPLENEIHHILVDASNNKWFSTTGGLSLLRGDRSPWDTKGWLGYNRTNSFLVDDNVQCVYLDEDNNEALIATEGGLSVYRGPFAEIEEQFTKTPAGPNPYILEAGSPKFVIKNLMFNSTVKILNINGKLVRELTPKTLLKDGTLAVDGGRAYWDGLDATGNRVASGIYLFLAISEEGKTISGKIAVIRK